MGRRAGKKRKKEDDPDPPDESGDPITSSDSEEEKEQENHAPYYVTDYKRLYPEDSTATEFVVFVETTDSDKPIGTRDLVTISNSLRRYNKGVKYLRALNKYKIGVYFEKPELANALLINKTYLNDNNFNATIPASSTETTGVIRNVPVKYTNKKIFTLLSCTKKIISVRRFFRKIPAPNGFTRQPTSTVAITFAATTLPDFVDLEGWRHNISQYVPPVKQCYRCLRYGHISKYCKNPERCSICNKNHNYKDCTIPTDKAVCAHCNGNHISISGQCPVKQKKIQENKTKHKASTFADLFDNKSFPKLKTPTKENKTPETDLLNILKSDANITNLLVESIIKIITLNKTNETIISSKNVLDILTDTFSKKVLLQNSKVN